MSKHVNIPIFIPHLGCPHHCVFCDQKKITGQQGEVTLSQAEEIIEKHLATIRLPREQIEIAYFGGSFTAIPTEKQEAYLLLANRYLDEGRVGGIRISTRPDAIDHDTLKRLQAYRVKTIELGAQSMDDSVLALSGRGHTAEQTRVSSRLIKEYGFDLGIQLMTGLCGDSPKQSLASAREIVPLGPACVRIYPTLVIKGTVLEKLYHTGSYRPDSLSTTIRLVGEMLNVFYKANIPVIRIGLASSESMTEQNDIIAGPNHPALRELCEGTAFLRVINRFLEGKPAQGKYLIIHAPATYFSRLSGHKKCNSTYLLQKFGLANIVFRPSDTISFRLE